MMPWLKWKFIENVLFNYWNLSFHTILINSNLFLTASFLYTFLCIHKFHIFIQNINFFNFKNEYLFLILKQVKNTFLNLLRYGSPHHNRSQSVKTPGRSSGRPNYLCLPQQRSRVASMPNTGVEEEYYRLRHFSITGKGVVNRGDSLKSRRSRSNNSVASSNSR